MFSLSASANHCPAHEMYRDDGLLFDVIKFAFLLLTVVASTPHQHLLARGRGWRPGSVAALQHGSSAPACMKQDLILPYFAQTLEAHCCALCRFRQRKCTTALQKVPKACTMGCKETSITLTQGDARVGGSSMLKFCSARRSGSHRIGKLYRAAARSTISRSCATEKWS